MCSPGIASSQGEERVSAFDGALAAQTGAAAVGFDWPEVEGVLAKAREEVSEVEAACRQRDLPHARRELGDLLFTAVNLSRFLDADPAVELDLATERFRTRFAAVEAEFTEANRPMRECSLEELDAAWDRVKEREFDRRDGA